MSITYRIASADDMELLLQSRTDTLRAVNHLADDYCFSEVFLDFSREYFREGDQQTVLAMDGSRAVGCATICYIRIMPTFSHPSGSAWTRRNPAGRCTGGLDLRIRTNVWYW